MIKVGVAENVKYVKEKIVEACKRANRDSSEIILVGVSKTHPIDKLFKAKEAGIETFGESKAQELMEKYEQLDGVKWHFIGHLQKNKVKYIIDKVELIHSLDDIELAKEIDKRAKNIGKVMDVLIQINIGKEESKYGIYKEDILDFCNSLSEFKNIKVKGLMCIPPAEASIDETRNYFRTMKQIFNDVKKVEYENFDIKYLSMGMSDDFEIAIEEGANIIRVGTGIFGERYYAKEEK